MPQFLVVGVAAGLASAVIFVSAAGGDVSARLILFLLTPLPGLLAGLGWGWRAAAACAAIFSAAVVPIGGVLAGLSIFATQGLPQVVLSYLAGAAQPSVVSGPFGAGSVPTIGPRSRPPVGVYAPGTILLVIAILAAALSFMALLLLGSDQEKLAAAMRKSFERMGEMFPQLGEQKLTDDEIKRIVEASIVTLQGMLPAMWVGYFVANLWLAGRITLASGRLPRAWPDLSTLTLPAATRIALAAALAVGMLAPAGHVKIVANVATGALLSAFLVMGLAIIHWLTRGAPARGAILVGVYASLLLLYPYAPITVALIAVLEPVLPWLKSRLAPASGPGGGPT